MLDTKTALQLKRKGWSAQRIAAKYHITRQAVYIHLAKARKARRQRKARKRKSRKIDYNKQIDWARYNQGLVKRGEFLLDRDQLRDWSAELRRMNKSKRGRPFIFPGCFVSFAIALKNMFQLDYRTLSGMLKQLFPILGVSGRTPNYVTLQRRLQGFKAELLVPVTTAEQEIGGDSTGLKSSNRGEYRMSKYKDGTRRRFVKLHLAVNIDTRQVVYAGVTDDTISDSRHLRKMITGSARFGKIKRGLFDKGYDGKENHWLLKTQGIAVGIRARESLPLKRLLGKMRRAERELEKKPDNLNLRKKLYRWKKLRSQSRDYRAWVRRNKYGQRWKVEGRYSVFKRIFGDSVYSKSAETTRNEVILKVNLLNRFTEFLAPCWS
jgi:hypothetical protein